MLIDLHCDTFMKLFFDQSINLKSNKCHIDLDKLKKASAMAQFFAMYVDLSQTNQPFQRVLDMIDLYHETVKKHSQEIQAAYSYQDLIDHQSSKVLSGILSVEEGGVIEGSISNLRNLHRLGVRAMTLTWNYENEIGFPNTYGNQNKGLKDFGRNLIGEMNALGMIVDVSHLSDQGFYDVIDLSSKPIMASHSNARSVCCHNRNLSDDMLRKLAENGGITGLNFCPVFVDNHKMTLDGLMTHVHHIVKVSGIDSLAIGTDFDGMGGDLEIKDMSYMPLLYERLKKEGFSSEERDKILYKNALRLIKDNF